MEPDWWARGAAIGAASGTLIAAIFASRAASASRRAADVMSRQLDDDRRERAKGELRDIADKISATWIAWRRTRGSATQSMHALRTAVSVCSSADDLQAVQPFINTSLDDPAPSREIYDAAIYDVRGAIQRLNERPPPPKRRRWRRWKPA